MPGKAKFQFVATKDGWTLRRWSYRYRHGWQQLELTAPDGQRLWFNHNGRRFPRAAAHRAFARQHPEILALLCEMLNVPYTPPPSDDLRQYISQMSPVARMQMRSALAETRRLLR